MSNIVLQASTSNVTVTSTPANITVTEQGGGATFNVTTTQNNVSVSSTPYNVSVSAGALVSNASVRTKLSVQNISGYGNLAYDNTLTSNGVIQFTGVSNSDIIAIIDDNPGNIRQHISATDPVVYNSGTGVISINNTTLLSGQTTDNLSEGTTNLYLNGSGTTDDLTEGSTNLYFTPAAFDARFATKTTSDLTEGTNLYYTNNRVNAQIQANVSGGYGITFNADNSIEVTNSEIQAQANVAIGNNTTDDLAEGNVNLYFTNNRVQQYLNSGVDGILVDNGNLTQTVGNIVLDPNTPSNNDTRIVGGQTDPNFIDLNATEGPGTHALDVKIRSGNDANIIIADDPVLAHKGNIRFYSESRDIDVFRTNTDGNFRFYNYAGDEVLEFNGDASSNVLQAHKQFTVGSSLTGDGAEVELIGNDSTIYADNSSGDAQLQIGADGNVFVEINGQSTTSGGKFFTLYGKGFDTSRSEDYQLFEVENTGNVIFDLNPADFFSGQSFKIVNDRTSGSETIFKVEPKVSGVYTNEGQITLFDHTTIKNPASDGGSLSNIVHIKGQVLYTDEQDRSRLYLDNDALLAGNGDVNIVADRTNSGSASVNLKDGTTLALQATGNQVGFIVDARAYANLQVDSHLLVNQITPLSNGNVELTGNLNVSGNLNYVNVEDLLVNDQSITLNYGNASSRDAFIFVDRSGDSRDNVAIKWNNTSNAWQLSNDGTTYSDIITTTGLQNYSGNLDNVGNITVSGQVKTDTINPYTGGGTISISGPRMTDVGIGTTPWFLPDSSPSDDQILVGYANNVVQWENKVLSTYGNAEVADFLENGFGSNSIVTTGNITADYVFATTRFEGDINGAIQAEIYNASGATLNKGDIVALNGAAHGSTPDVVLADYGNASLMPGFGVVKNSISPTATGEVVISGRMNFAGHGFTVGAQLYVNGAGQFTETSPQGEGNLVQKIATVTNSNTINVAGAGRTNATPNLDQGNIFIGDSNNYAVTVAPGENFVTSDVQTLGSNVAITLIAGNLNAGTTTDIMTFSGGQIYTDGTLIRPNSLTGSPFTSYNGNDYYVKYNALQAAYELWNDAGFTSAVLISGSSLDLSPVGFSETFTTTTTPIFELSNALSNVNSISTETDTNFTVKQNFNGTYSSTLEVDGDGYAFRNNNLYTNQLTKTGANVLQAYKITGNIVTGNTDIVISSVNRWYDNAAASVSDLKVGMSFENSQTFAGDPIGFPQYVYVSAVDGANNKVTMSEVGQANVAITAGAMWDALVDTTRNQVVRLLSDLDAGGSSNTALNTTFIVNDDAYGYPSTGFTMSAFDVISAGVSGDYSWNANIANFMVGKTQVTPNDTAIKAHGGIVIGANTSLTNRAEFDSLESIGINSLWDGVDSTGYNNKINQFLLKQYSDNSALTNFSSGSGGPRIFFSSASGKQTDYAYDTYPREGQELGRLTWWGTNAQSLTQSTFRPPALLTVQAATDWTTAGQVAGNTNMYLGATSNHANGADLFLAYKAGELILASPGGTGQGVTFAPSKVNTNTPDTVYDGSKTTWANISYANVSASSGAKVTVTNGASSGAGTVGDMQISLDRLDNSGNLVHQNGFTDFNFLADSDGFGPADAIKIGQGAQGSQFLPGLSNGDPILIDNFTGQAGTDYNGQVRYAKYVTYFTTFYFIELYTDAGLTTPSTSSTGGYYSANFGSAGSIEYVNSSGVTAREWTLNLAEQSDDLVVSTNGTTSTTFHSNTDVTFAGNVNTSLKQFNETVVALGNQSGNVSANINAVNGSIFTMTANGGVTINTIPNATAGSSYTLKITQDGTGSRTLSSTFKFAGGTNTLSTGAGNIDVISVVYDGTDYLASLTTDYK